MQASRFGLAVDDELLEVSAQKLPLPQVVYRDPRTADKIVDVNKNNPKWGFLHRHFVQPFKGQIKYACIQFTEDGRDVIDAKRFVAFQRAFETASGNVGLKTKCVHEGSWSNSRGKPDNNVWSINYSNVDERIVHEALTTWKNAGATVILVWLARRHVALYSRIKRAGDILPNADVESSIATICMVLRDKQPNNHPQYLSNIQMKLNMKINDSTINHTTRVLSTQTNRPSLLGTNTMLVGLDVVSNEE